MHWHGNCNFPWKIWTGYCWPSMRGTVKSSIHCTSYLLVLAAAGSPWKGPSIWGPTILVVTLMPQRLLAVYERLCSWQVPLYYVYLYACFSDSSPSIEGTIHSRFRSHVCISLLVSGTVDPPLKGLFMASLCLFQRSVLNATDAQKVHGHGHDIIVYRQPTFKRPRPPDVNTVNPP